MCLSPVGLVCCMWSRISRCWWPNWSWRISERFGGMDIYIIYFTFTLTHKNLYGKKPFSFSTECAHLMIVSFQVEKFEITHERNMICLRLHKIEITQERINVIFYVYFILSWMKNDNFEVQGGEVAHKLWRWPPTSILFVITFFCNRLFHVHIVQIHLNGLQYHEVCPLSEKKLLLVLSAPTMGSACANWCNVNITHG